MGEHCGRTLPSSWAPSLTQPSIPSHEEDILDLDFGVDDDVASMILLSEDKEEDDIFITLARAAHCHGLCHFSGQ